MRAALFDTAIGTCGLVWTLRGVRGVHLPDGNAAEARVSIQRRFPDAVLAEPDAAAARAIARMVALLDGRDVDLSDITIDPGDRSPFEQRVDAETRRIPRGSVSTYGAIASALGEPSLARAVGQALGRNPSPLVVPCHRVVAANDSLGGFSAPGGSDTKRRLLAIEGVTIAHTPRLFSRRCEVARVRGCEGG